MPLQGTIDSFPLADVLTLLDSTSRVGRLSVTGDRVSGWVEMAGGQLIAGQLLGSSDVSARSALLELLRCQGGEFEFLSLQESELSSGTSATESLAACLTESALRLERWVEVEKVLPSTHHQIRLVAQLPSAEIVVDSFRWSLLVAVRGSSAVSEILLRVDADELDVCSALTDLVAEGLAEVVNPAECAEAPQLEVETYEPAPTAFPEQFPEHFPIDDLVGLSDHDPSDPWHRVTEIPSSGSIDASYEPAELGTAAAAWDDLVFPSQQNEQQESTSDEQLRRSESPTATDEDVFRQMSTLSPQAAEAIAAALSASPALDEPSVEASSGAANSIVDVELATTDPDQGHLGADTLTQGYDSVEDRADLALDADVDDPLGPISFIGSF